VQEVQREAQAIILDRSGATSSPENVSARKEEMMRMSRERLIKSTG
jgi:hypothetical protein